MWFIQRKQAGRDPPAALTPDMVPPSLRPKGQDAVSYCPFSPHNISNGERIVYSKQDYIFLGKNF